METSQHQLILSKPKPREQAPPGVYEATFESFEDLGEQAYGGYAAKPTLRLHFGLNKLDSKGEFFSASTLATASLHRKSKLHSIVLALLGSVPDRLDMSALEGRLCRVIISQRRDEQGRLWANIDTILSAETQPQSSTPPGFLFDSFVKRAGHDFTLPAKEENL